MQSKMVEYTAHDQIREGACNFQEHFKQINGSISHMPWKWKKIKNPAIIWGNTNSANF